MFSSTRQLQQTTERTPMQRRQKRTAATTTILLRSAEPATATPHKPTQHPAPGEHKGTHKKTEGKYRGARSPPEFPMGTHGGA